MLSLGKPHAAKNGIALIAVILNNSSFKRMGVSKRSQLCDRKMLIVRNCSRKCYITSRLALSGLAYR